MNIELSELSPEGRIQFIFKTQNDVNDVRVQKLRYILQNDPSPVVRHEAAYVLGEIDNPKSFEFLAETIKTDLNRFVVHEAALAIANLGKKGAKTVLEPLLKHPDRDVSLTAEIAIERLRMKLNSEKIKFENACHVLLDQHSHPEHRIQASFLLMDEGSLNSIECLIKGLAQETNPIVKHEIIFSLGETASEAASNALIESITKDENHFVIHETLLALSTLNFERAKPVIESYINNEVDEIRESAEIALERLTGVGNN